MELFFASELIGWIAALLQQYDGQQQKAHILVKIPFQCRDVCKSLETGVVPGVTEYTLPAVY